MAAVTVTSPEGSPLPGHGPGHDGSTTTRSTLLSGTMAPNQDGLDPGTGANLLSLQWHGGKQIETKLDGSRGSSSCPVPTANIEQGLQLPRSSSYHSRSGQLLSSSGRDPLATSMDLQSSAIFADWRQSKEAMEMLFQEADGRAGRTTQSFFEWMKVRMPYYEGNALLIFLHVVFGLVCIIAKGELQALGTCDILPVMTTASGVSLVIALVVALAMKGGSSIVEIFYSKNIVHFSFVALLMAAWIPCFIGAKALGATSGSIGTVGALYLPVSAIMSYFMMRRDYGALEGFSLMIMTLAIMIMFHLRPDSIQPCEQWICTLDSSTFGSFVLLLFGFAFLAISSMYAERVYKNQFFFRNNGNAVPAGDKQAIYINKAQLDFLCLICSGVLWAVQQMALPATPSKLKCSADGGITLASKHVVWVVACIAWGWLTCAMSKYFSTVSRCIVEVFIYTSVTLCIFPLWGKFFEGEVFLRLIAIILITMAILSVLVFQTGRLIIASVVEYSGMDRSMAIQSDISIWQSFMASIRACNCTTLREGLMKWGTMVLFIMSDAARAMASQKAIGGLYFTPLTFAMMISVVGVVVASISTVWLSDSWMKGLVSLRKAYHPLIIIKYFPCGFLFGITNVFTALAFSNGVSAGMNTAIGYIYTPFAAIASAFVLRKYYMWLEWFGICILTCALTTFGVMTSFYQDQEQAKKGSAKAAAPIGELCVVASALVSVVGSLVSEKILKAEDRPFHEQKIALDIGSAISVLLVLYPVGWVETDWSSDPEPKYSIEKLRPVSIPCNDDACWKVDKVTKSFINCGTSLCSCHCESGFWAAWGEALPLIVFALAINVIQGWLTGMVIKQFSTVGRALAQSFTLLVIYFIGDHLITSKSPHTMALALTACTLPLSNMIFVNAAVEMQKLIGNAA